MNKPRLSEQMPAKGHTCCINRFDAETVMIPFNEKELRRLETAFFKRMELLHKSGDYPEINEDGNTLGNLQSAMFMLSIKEK